MQPESLPRMCWYHNTSQYVPILLPEAMLTPMATSVICDATGSNVGIPVPCCNRRQCWCTWPVPCTSDRAMMLPMIHIAAWGYADVHIWFYHHRTNRSPWTELMAEAMLISMVNVVNTVTPNRVYVHKLSCHQSPYWCPQPMFIVYAVTWSHIDFHGLGYHWRPCGRMGSVLLPESMWLSTACAVVAMAYVCGSCFYQRLCWFCHLGS